MTGLRRVILIAVLVAAAALAAVGVHRVHADQPPPAAAAPPPSLWPAALARDCGRGAKPGFFGLALTSGGRSRAALLQVPRRALGRRAPLVVVLHGAGRSGPFMPRYSGFDHVAGAGGFLAVYPSALGSPPFWNLGPADARHPDDVGFVRDLVDGLNAGGCVDPARVFVVGVSNGGGLAARLACEASDRFAAAAIVAGGVEHLPPCDPGRPVSILEIHGTDDRVVPYAGAPDDDAPGGIPGWVRGWAQRDRCAGRPAVSRIAPDALRYDYRGCAGGAAVSHVAILHGAHAWPGATPPDPGPRSDLSAAALAWRFVQGHVVARPFAAAP